MGEGQGNKLRLRPKLLPANAGPTGIDPQLPPASRRRKAANSALALTGSPGHLRWATAAARPTGRLRCLSKPPILRPGQPIGRSLPVVPGRRRPWQAERILPGAGPGSRSKAKASLATRCGFTSPFSSSGTTLPQETVRQTEEGRAPAAEHATLDDSIHPSSEAGTSPPWERPRWRLPGWRYRNKSAANRIGRARHGLA